MHYRFQSGDTVYDVSLERKGESWQAVIDSMAYDFDLLDATPGVINLRFGERPVTLYWAAEAGKQWISVEGCTYLLEKPSPKSARRPGERAAEDVVRSPMPAQVRSVQVREGQAVEKGQTIMLLEAMKMEIRLQAPRSGNIAKLLASEGQSVERNQILCEIEEG